MSLDLLPSFVSHYCEWCGAPLIFQELHIQPDGSSVTTICSSCNRTDWRGWGSGGFSSRALMVFEDGSSKIVHLPPLLEQTDHFCTETRAKSEQFHDLFEQRGFASFVETSSHSLFAIDASARQWHYRWWDGGPGYVTPTYAAPDNAIYIYHMDMTKLRRFPPNWRSLEPELAAKWAIPVLSGVLLRLYSFRHLHRNEAFYQYININRLMRAPITTATLSLASGEITTWNIKLLEEPVSIAFAWTLIEQADVSVGVAGPCATRIEDMLSQLKRLTPDCPEIDRLNEGKIALRDFSEGQ